MYALSPLDLIILQAIQKRAMQPKTIADTLPERYRLSDADSVARLVRSRIARMVELGLIKQGRRSWIHITRQGRSAFQTLN